MRMPSIEFAYCARDSHDTMGDNVQRATCHLDNTTPCESLLSGWYTRMAHIAIPVLECTMVYSSIALPSIWHHIAYIPGIALGTRSNIAFSPVIILLFYIIVAAPAELLFHSSNIWYCNIFIFLYFYIFIFFLFLQSDT